MKLIILKYDSSKPYFKRSRPNGTIKIISQNNSKIIIKFLINK
jgi:hypothetical protein